MIKQTETKLLEEAFEFIQKQKPDTRKKILHSIRRTEINTSQKSFKKLINEIWEFKIMYVGLRCKFFVFWDNDNNRKTLVFVKPELIKKTKEEVLRVNSIRINYLSKRKYNL
jgi:hypothetical protein